MPHGMPCFTTCLPLCCCQGDIDTKLAQQSQQAMTLEASLASAEAACRDLEADVQVREGNRLRRSTWSSRQADDC